MLAVLTVFFVGTGETLGDVIGREIVPGRPAILTVRMDSGKLVKLNEPDADNPVLGVCPF